MFFVLLGTFGLVMAAALLADRGDPAAAPADASLSSECAIGYRQARTADDTARVDRWRPGAVGRQNTALACGAQRRLAEYRRTGR